MMLLHADADKFQRVLRSINILGSYRGNGVARVSGFAVHEAAVRLIVRNLFPTDSRDNSPQRGSACEIEFCYGSVRGWAAQHFCVQHPFRWADIACIYGRTCALRASVKNGSAG